MNGFERTTSLPADAKYIYLYITSSAKGYICHKNIGIMWATVSKIVQIQHA